MLYDLGCAFAARIELDELIPLVVAKCREVLNAEGISVLLLDQEHNQLYFPYVSQVDPEIIERLLKLALSRRTGGRRRGPESGQAIRVTDAQHDPRLYHGVDLVTGDTTRDLLAVPLITHQGTIGVIEAVNSRGAQPFSEEDLAFLEALGRQYRGGDRQCAPVCASTGIRGQPAHPGWGAAAATWRAPTCSAR